MEVRKILGGASVEGSPTKFSIGKLHNGSYTVGHLVPGEKAEPSRIFQTLDAAFDYWYAALPGYSPEQQLAPFPLKICTAREGETCPA